MPTIVILCRPGSLGVFLTTWAVVVNGVLGITNLLPLFPLDGGHVFRAVLMAVLGGTVLPTLISGGLSLAVGGFGVWWVVGEVRDGGWEALRASWLLGLYSAVVVLGSFVALLSIFDRRPVEHRE